jgi:N-acetylglucosaminyldiphosphoundecaprenol N-acetyl-beta-D-mannosaminyltransferase
MQNKGSLIQIPAPIVEILDIPVWGLTLDQSVELAFQLILSKQKAVFSTINTYSIITAQDNAEFKKHFKTADVVLPDGIGIVLAARYLSKGCPERVAGPEFVDSFLPVAEKNGVSILFFGSSSSVLEKIKANVVARYPEINIAGLYSPPFGPIDSFDDEHIVNWINEKRPDVLFVGMTAPKQELWLSTNYQNLNVPFMMGIGASFEYLAGTKTQTPKFIGKIGFEWLYRLCTSPKHVWRREITIPIFIYYFVKRHILGKR